MLGVESPLEIALVAFLVVLLFGTKRLPELGSGFGKAIANFKKSYNEGTAIDVTPGKERLDQPAVGQQKEPAAEQPAENAESGNPSSPAH